MKIFWIGKRTLHYYLRLSYTDMISSPQGLLHEGKCTVFHKYKDIPKTHKEQMHYSLTLWTQVDGQEEQYSIIDLCLWTRRSGCEPTMWSLHQLCETGRSQNHWKLSGCTVKMWRVDVGRAWRNANDMRVVWRIKWKVSDGSSKVSHGRC